MCQRLKLSLNSMGVTSLTMREYTMCWLQVLFAPGSIPVCGMERHSLPVSHFVGNVVLLDVFIMFYFMVGILMFQY